MAHVDRPHVYPEGTVAQPDHANANEIVLYNVINGNIDWENLKAALANVANGLVKIGADGKVPPGLLPINTEVVNARGEMESLDERLDVELNEDGTLKVQAGELCWVLQGNAYVQAGLGYCLVGVALAKKSISKVKIYALAAPTGTSLIVDVNKNGTTIFTTQSRRPEVAAGGHSDDSEAPNVTALSEGDRLSFDVDQVGSTVAGGNPLLITIVLAQE